MLTSLANRINGMERNYLLFLLATVCIGVGQSVDGATMTNYLKENLHMLILERSALEFPRELPGLLTFLVIGMLHFLGDVRMAAVGHLLSAMGMFLLGVIPPQYSMAVMVIFIYSMGSHIYFPLSNSIGMSFASAGEMGRKLGQISSANTAALVVSSAVLWGLFQFWTISYQVTFTIGALSFLAAALLMLGISIEKKGMLKGPRFIFKREYGLYYWLSILFGARKQVFITFGPWVLVDIFKQPVTTMTVLFFIVSVTGIFIKPWVGRLIDRVGEKKVLMGEAAAFFFICLGYAFAEDIWGTWAVAVVSCCYIVDQALSAASIARATYLKKIAMVPEDVVPTLSVGTSMDHISTMFLPIIGGLVWFHGGPNGYKYVFIGGAVIALLNFFSTRRISFDQKGELQNRA